MNATVKTGMCFEDDFAMQRYAERLTERGLTIAFGELCLMGHPVVIAGPTEAIVFAVLNDLDHEDGIYEDGCWWGNDGDENKPEWDRS